MTRPTRRAVQWWAGNLAGPVIFLVLTVISFLMGDTWQAVTDIVVVLVLGLYLVLSLSWFTMGFRRGMDDFAEAALRAGSPDEFLRLTLDTRPPRPWQ